MSGRRSWLLAALALALLAAVHGAPIWEELFGLPPAEPARRPPQQRHYDYGRNRQPAYRESRAQSGKEKYKATCWVLSADNYAFPGQSPYPSAPLCPY